MATHSTQHTPTSLFVFADPTGELAAFCDNYRPDCLPESLWLGIAADCIELVKRAGTPARERIRQDLQVLAAGAAAVAERGRPVTIEEILSDYGLHALDCAMVRERLAKSTRANRRAVGNRLQTHHRGLPWQVGRQRDHCDEVPARHRATAEIEQLLGAARTSDDTDAAAFLAAVERAVEQRRESAQTFDVHPSGWDAAVRFAARHDIALTRRLVTLAAGVTILARTAPVAALISTYRLTRRDLDRAVITADAMPYRPDEATATALRGSSQN